MKQNVITQLQTRKSQNTEVVHYHINYGGDKDDADNETNVQVT